MSLYEESWKLYKAATEDLDFDFLYYFDLCRFYKTIELCAGFGRLSNLLHASGVDITAVELEKSFISYLTLPKDRIINDDILNLSGDIKYSRVISPYNSFCLFTNDNIDKFFSMLARVLADDGLASISYYHQDYWYHLEEGEWNISLDGENFTYTFDFSKDPNNSFWLDKFKSLSSGNVMEYTYPIKIYDSFDEVEQLCNKHGMYVSDIIKHNYELEPGWFDIIIRKNKPGN